MKDQIEKVVRYTITLPLTLAIKIDIEREINDHIYRAYICIQIQISMYFK